MKAYIGIDNGTTGTIGIIETSGSTVVFQSTPVKQEFSYTKKAQQIHRVDVDALEALLKPYAEIGTKIYIERPMVNPRRFKATVSALRALEATLIIIERLKLPYRYIDSKEWQRALLPAGLKKEQLKTASKQIGQRLFPSVPIKGTDADGLLLAEYCRQKETNTLSNGNSCTGSTNTIP